MSDLEPWLDGDAPPELRALLRAAQNEAPSPRRVQRALLATVAASSATGVALGAAGGAKAASALSASMLLQWGLGGIVLGSVVSVATVVAHRSLSEAGPAPSAHSAPAASPTSARTVAHPSAVARDFVENPSPTAAVATGVAVPPARAAALRPPAEAPPAVDGGERLDAEVALIDAARKAVEGQQLDRALQLLDAHDQRFGRSAALSPEARYLRLEALTKAHRLAEARAAAAEILRRDPASPHRERARSVLDSRGAGAKSE